MPSFSPWEDLRFPGHLIGGQTIAACSWAHEQLDVFAIGVGPVGNTLTLELWHKYYDERSESPWMHVDRGIYGICAVSPHQGRMDLFGVYTDNQLWHKWYINNGDRKDGTWSEWEPLGQGALDPGPGLSQYGVGACSSGPSRIEVFALYRDQPHELLHRIYSDRWYSWGSLGSERGLESAPTAVSSGSGRIDLFARSNTVNGDLLHKRRVNKSWTEWRTVGTGLALPYGVGVCLTHPDTLDILYRDSNLKMWHGVMLDDHTISEWRDVTGQVGAGILSTPTAVSDRSDVMRVFAQSENGSSILRTWYLLD